MSGMSRGETDLVADEQPLPTGLEDGGGRRGFQTSTRVQRYALIFGLLVVFWLALTKKYGWDFFEKLAKNNPRVGRSGNDPVTLVNAGEALIGPAPGNTAFQQVDKGNPITPVYTADGSTLCLGPSSIMASAPHPNAARLYMEWLLSDDFAKLSVANHGDPVHPGLALTSGQKPLDQIPILSLTTEEVGKGIPDIIERWRDTFGS